MKLLMRIEGVCGIGVPIGKSSGAMCLAVKSYFKAQSFVALMGVARMKFKERQLIKLLGEYSVCGDEPGTGFFCSCNLSSSCGLWASLGIT